MEGPSHDLNLFGKQSEMDRPLDTDLPFKMFARYSQESSISPVSQTTIEKR